MNTLEIIQKTNEKLRDLLKPLILEQYPEIREFLIDLAFHDFGLTVEKWNFYMSVHVIPHIDLIKEPVPNETIIELPQVVPGFHLQPVPREIAVKTREILMFFLNLYEWLNGNQ